MDMTSLKSKEGKSVGIWGEFSRICSLLHNQQSELTELFSKQKCMTCLPRDKWCRLLKTCMLVSGMDQSSVNSPQDSCQQNHLMKMQLYLEIMYCACMCIIQKFCTETKPTCNLTDVQICFFFSFGVCFEVERRETLESWDETVLKWSHCF